MSQIRNFTEGKILAPLLSFSAPILLATLLQAMYGAIDLVVVGHFGDAASVSAVATGSHLMQTITGVITGLSMGVTTLLGKRIGAKHYEAAADTIGNSVLIFAVLSAAISAAAVGLAPQIAAAMQAPQEAFSKTVAYFRICSAGILFITGYNLLGSVFRGMGNSRLPLVFVAISTVVNIAGDLLLIGVFRLDAAGAAIATVFAQSFSMVMALVIIKRQGLGFAFARGNIRFKRPVAAKILRLGAPIALQDSLTNVSFLLMTSIFNAIGLSQSAAFGVGEKLVVFLMLVPIAFMSSVSAFSAQNIGVGRYDRARRATACATVCSLVFGAAMFFAVFFKGSLLASLFSNKPDVIAYSAQFLKAYAIDCVLVGPLFCLIGYFNGSFKTVFVMFQSFFAALLVRVPYSYIASRKAGASMFEIGLASPVATLAALFICIIYYVRLKKEQDGNLKEVF